MPKKKFEGTPVEEPEAAVQKVVSLRGFLVGAATLVDWCAQSFFPECPLHTDLFDVKVTVEDEQEAQMNEYRVDVCFLTETRDIEWFNNVAVFASALARPFGGDHLRKVSMAVNYTETGFAVLVRVIVPKFKPAMLV